MRRIAAHYLFSQGECIPRPIVECDSAGRILKVGRWQRLDTLPETEFYAGALCAGFVNAHSHLELSYLKGAIAEGEGFAGFARSIGQLRGGFSEQERQQAIAAADATMWYEGVQAVADIVNDESAFPIKERSAIHYRSFAELFGLNTPAQKMDSLKHYPNTSLTPHSTYSLQQEQFLYAAAPHTLSIHFMESEDEQALFRGEGSLAAWYNRMGWECDFLGFGSPVERLTKSLPKDKQLLLVHCCCCKQEDVKALCGHFTTPPVFVLCPQSNHYISRLTPPATLLWQMGAEVAIGTDSLASNHNLSMLEEVKCLGDIPLEVALGWATMGGAKALGLEAELGSVEEGKRPGIVLIEGIETSEKGLRLSPSARSKRLI